MIQCWLNTAQPEQAHKTITFDDCTLRVNPGVNGAGRLSQLQKSKINECYFGIPISICQAVADNTLLRLRAVLATSYAIMI